MERRYSEGFGGTYGIPTVGVKGEDLVCGVEQGIVVH